MSNECLCIPQQRITHHYHPSLLLSCGTCLQWGAGLSALLSSANLPVTVSFSSSVCKTLKWFCRGTSGFESGFFLLLVFLTAIIHLPSLLASPLTGCAGCAPWGYLATDCVLNAGCTWVELSIFISSSQILHTLLHISHLLHEVLQSSKYYTGEFATWRYWTKSNECWLTWWREWKITPFRNSWESWDCSDWQNEGLMGDLINLYKYPKGRWKENGASTLFSGSHWENMRQWCHSLKGYVAYRCTEIVTLGL